MLNCLLHNDSLCDWLAKPTMSALTLKSMDYGKILVGEGLANHTGNRIDEENFGQ